MANPSMMTILRDLLSSKTEEELIPIALEAQRTKERLSSIPFYAKMEVQEGDKLWVRLSVSYTGTD
jgi:hypothetical protein